MQLTQWLHKGCREYPNRVAVVCEGRRTTFKELFSRVVKLAGALRSLGVRPDDRVGVLSPNTDRYLEAYLGIWWAGAIINPVNCRWSVDEIAYSLEDSATRVLLVDEIFMPMLPAIRNRSPSLNNVVRMGGAITVGAEDYETLLTKARPVPDARRGGDDAAALFYTGGTTGKPKGVLLSHGGLYVTTLASINIGERDAGAVCLHALPMFHVGGMAVVLQAIAGACTQVMQPVFDPAGLLELIEREHVSEAALVPTMIRRVVDHKDVQGRDIGTLKRLFYGASPIDGTLLEQTIARLPGVALTQFYGMTETSGIAVALPPWCHSADSRAKGYHLSAGLPTPCAELRIVGPDNEDLPAGQIGEIELRGPGVMLSYWNLPEQTAQVLHEGWMRTGDGGYLDAQGLLYIVDRIKDMIVTGGENVYSVEVENAVLSLPGIAQCAVVGVPDDKWGERVHAAIVLQPGAVIDEANVIEHCKKLIAGYKCPRSIEFRMELPVSGAGKLLKYKLREPHWEGRTRRVG